MNIRPAIAQDQDTIKRIVHAANINPLNLDWRHFIVAEEDGQIVGIGQIKTHGDGSRELASIATIPERQGQGIASQIIRTLLARETGELYLMCRSPLESFYSRFGFRRIGPDEMPPYFRRIMRVARLFTTLMRERSVQGIIMKKERP